MKAHGAGVIETDNAAQLKQFRGAVTKKICRFFADVKDLKLIVLESLAHIVRDPSLSLSGWVPGSEVIDPKSLIEEAGRLRQENDGLRQRIVELESHPVVGEFDGATFEEVAQDLAGRSISVVEIPYPVVETIRAAASSRPNLSLLRMVVALAQAMATGLTFHPSDKPTKMAGETLSTQMPRLVLYGLADQEYLNPAGVLYTLTTSARRFINLVRPHLDRFDPLPPGSP